MKQFLTLTTALFALHIASAQAPTFISKTLNWDEKAATYQFDSTAAPLEYWRFEGAAFNEEHPSLPYFSQRFKLDKLAEVRADFGQMVWQAFDKKASPDDAMLADEPQLTINVEKDRRDYFARLQFIPIRKLAGGNFERLVSFELRISYLPKQEPAKARGGNTFTSVLSDGEIYKFAVTQAGVHKLDFDFLKDKLGVPMDNLDPRTLKIYGNGGGMLPELAGAPRADDLIENPIEVVGEGDGKFDKEDYLLFYAEGADKWRLDTTTKQFNLPKNFYDSENYYFLKISPGNGLRIQNQPSSTNNDGGVVTTFDDFIRFEIDSSNLLHEWVQTQGSGRQWFGEYFKVQTSADFSEEFQVDNLVANAPAKLSAVFAARIKSGHTARFSVTANGSTFTSPAFTTTGGSATDTFAGQQSVSGEFTPNSDQFQVKLDFTKPDDIFNEGWLDYIQINFRRQLLMAGEQLIFRDLKTMGQASAQFRLGNASSQVTIWDISEPLSPKRQEASLSGNELTFIAPTGTLKEFIAFNTGGDFLKPEAVGKIENQNVHATTDVDVVIIYPKEFKPEAERLAEHRSKHSNLTVKLVEVGEIFNEFASGRTEATAIRDFAKMVYDRNPDRFRSLVLFGDGSFDHRNVYRLGGNFVPVYETVQTLNPITAYPSDDFFAMLSDDEGTNINAGALDIGVGRFPVDDLDEARAMVNKVIQYDTDPNTLRDWRNRVVFVGDDEDSNTHTGGSDRIAVRIAGKNKNLNIDKIYLDAFPQVSTSGGTRTPLATEAINNNIFKGALAMVYLGHGGPKGWAQERVVKIEDILGWRNEGKLPLIITATCTFGGYDNPNFTTGGELSFLNETGGAIALFTTVRPVYAYANEQLTQDAVDTLFFKLNNQVPTLGEVLRLSKNKAPGNTSNSRKFALLGDPSMQLALPNYQVATTKINGHDLDTALVDTIRALQKVTIEGEVTDDFGNPMPNFNGVVYPTIYDKKVRYRTLGQDGQNTFEFDLQKNVIFKGRASVTGGKFQFTFVVPKDIDYKFGNAKISYYAADPDEASGKHDAAAGSYEGMVVGGTDPNALADDQGPKVEVFMNDENFVFGGITDPDPVLLVKVSDDNGINVVGNSIGHDLAGILDKNTQNTYILNDFYEAALDDHTKGEVRYPLYNLAEGRHEVKVTAWDIANNPAEGFTEFVVVTSEKLALEHVLNYPNPFTTSTCFMFELSQKGVELDVQVQIYTVSGRLIKTLEERIIAAGSRLGRGNCVAWDGRDEFGEPLAKGVYLYKVKVRSANTGETTLQGESDFEKLVILK